MNTNALKSKFCFASFSNLDPQLSFPPRQEVCIHGAEADDTAEGKQYNIF